MTGNLPFHYENKVKFLTKALFLSAILNMGTLGLLVYWVTRERLPTPYFQLKPLEPGQQQVSLADTRTLTEVVASFHKMPFHLLIDKLNSSLLIEDGYTERDLALGSLVATHHFDLARALPTRSYALQKRVLKWKDNTTGEWLLLPVIPGLTDKEFETLIHFAKTERWPMTTQGVFLNLQKQKMDQNIDPSLVEAFKLTSEFLMMELLFKRKDLTIRKERLMEVVLEGSWDFLHQFTDQQKHSNDLSDARRQKLLLDYIKQGSQSAAYLLLELDGEFAVKKLDDEQIISILQLLPIKTAESERFALASLTSPRNNSVWQQASLRLYEYAGEPIPKDWNYQTSLKRFAPDKVVATISKPISAPVQPIETVVKPIKPVAVKTPTVSSVPKKAPADRLYIVQEGDSLWKISRRFGVDMEVLKKRNNLQTNSIKPGTVLKIP